MKTKIMAAMTAALLGSAILAAPASAAVTYSFAGEGSFTGPQSFILETADYIKQPSSFTQFTSANIGRAEFCFAGQICSGFTPNTSALALTSRIGTNFYYFGANTFTMNGTSTSSGSIGTLVVSGSPTPLTPAVPEPATWAMMIMGFGLVGFGMRYSMRKSNANFDLKVKRIAAGLEA